MASKTDLKQIMGKMEIGINLESTENAKTWLKNRVIHGTSDNDPQGDTIDIKDVNTGEKLVTVFTPSKEVIDKTLESKERCVSLEKRTKLLNSFSSLIAQETALICELEICVRGISSKDTKTKALPLLIESLQYYSTKVQSFTKDCYVAVLSKSISLGCLGWILGPALATGYNIILQTDAALSVIATLLIELANKAGFPEGTIQLLPGKIDLNVFNRQHVRTVSIFDSMYSEKLGNVKYFKDKGFANFYDDKIPMVVFDGADLDSACESAIDAVWGYQGQLPWSVNTILVQEDILEAFVKKMQYKLSNTKIGKGNDKTADISYPVIENSSEKLQKIVKDAALQGIEIFQVDPKLDKFQPTLLIGGQVYGNNVMSENRIDVPVATVLGFRTVNEGIALANNTKQGLAASIWTENIGLANEVCNKLNVGTIWVNGHGIFDASNSIYLLKSSGSCYFGGIHGLKDISEMMNTSPPLSPPPGPTTVSFQSFIGGTFKKSEGGKFDGIHEHPIGKDLHNAVQAAKKGHAEWKKLSPTARKLSLILLAEQLRNKLDALSNGNEHMVKWIEAWVEILNKSTSEELVNTSSYLKSYDLKSYQVAHGIIAIESNFGYDQYPMVFIAAALVTGNSVIILNNDLTISPFYTELCKMLSSCKIPSGVVNVIMNNNADVTSAAILHKEINIYISKFYNCLYCNMPLRDCQKMKILKGKEILDYAFHYVTFIKNVWTNCGHSFM